MQVVEKIIQKGKCIQFLYVWRIGRRRRMVVVWEKPPAYTLKTQKVIEVMVHGPCTASSESALSELYEKAAINAVNDL